MQQSACLALAETLKLWVACPFGNISSTSINRTERNSVPKRDTRLRHVLLYLWLRMAAGGLPSDAARVQANPGFLLRSSGPS